MLTSGSGAIWLSVRFGWHVALLAMAGLLALGVLVTLAAPEPHAAVAQPRAPGWRARLEAAFLAPLRDFLTRPAAFQVLAFVILFRLGKVFADGTAAPFYRYGLGFGSGAVASANFFSIFGTLAGAAAGGWLVLRLGTMRALLFAGLVQAGSLGLYLVLLATGPDPAMLTGKVVLEAFAGAMADAAFLTYVSALCSSAYTATQYALLSSLAALAFHTLGGFSGYAAEALGYRAFYAATVLASLPALLIMLRLRRPLQAAKA
jgi:PAT family beta-lactamase induction signal transducer AmpG